MKNGAMRGSKRRYGQKGNGGFLKEKRGRFYIIRRCIAMLLCWRDWSYTYIYIYMYTHVCMYACIFAARELAISLIYIFVLSYCMYYIVKCLYKDNLFSWPSLCSFVLGIAAFLFWILFMLLKTWFLGLNFVIQLCTLRKL